MTAVLLLLLLSVLTTALSDTVPPPENVELSWSQGLYSQLSWTPPKDLDPTCTYDISYTTRNQDPVMQLWDSSPWTAKIVMDGGYIRITIQTVCGERKSEEVSVVRDYPDLGLSCAIMSASLTRCSWTPPPSTRLRFFYKFPKNQFNELRECPLYNSQRTSCDLQVNASQHMIALLNGTQGNKTQSTDTQSNGTLSNGTQSNGTQSNTTQGGGTQSDETIRNVHYFTGLAVRLAALNLRVKESKEKFFLSWDAADFNYLDWKYIINYTVCSDNKTEETSELHHELTRVAECPYGIAVRGKTPFSGGTEWMPYKPFDAVSGSNPMVFAVIVVPLVLVVMVILTLLWWKKNKDKVFPKVPQPNPELFKDLLNNNKTNVPDFYFPRAEEEDCPVSVVVDSRQNKL